VAKYRQHGYQDRDRDNERKGSGERSGAGASPPKRDNTFGPRPVNMPGTRAVSRCAQCGTVLQGSSGEGKCPKCAFELHSCRQCTYFDPGSRFECMQPIPVRIPKKDERNGCTFYEMRVTREKETSTPVTARPNDARAAFENLFKK
jgi:phage FluMu protein Com